jgi:hypothetical protein
MPDFIDAAVVSAARAAVRHGLRASSQLTPVRDIEVLERSVECHSFQRGALVPIRSVVERGVTGLEKRLTDGSSDDEVAAAWEAAISVATSDFSIQPESWLDEPSLEFIAVCGRVFGVHDAVVPSLLRTFHSQARSTRFAIFVKLLSSDSFSYLLREIRAMPEESDLDIDDPTDSFRALIRHTCEGAHG